MFVSDSGEKAIISFFLKFYHLTKSLKSTLSFRPYGEILKKLVSSLFKISRLARNDTVL